MFDLKKIVAEFCDENELSIRLSHHMPAGYESAYGTYDVTINTLFLNMAVLQNAPEYKVLFYLFHELRHAVQYLRPLLFSRQIQESRHYVILYNGSCYKLIGNAWHETALEGSEEYFTRAYLSLPYELDANQFAYAQTGTLCGDTTELKELYAFWMPPCPLDYNEHEMLFSRIDHALAEKR